MQNFLRHLIGSHKRLIFSALIIGVVLVATLLWLTGLSPGNPMTASGEAYHVLHFFKSTSPLSIGNYTFQYHDIHPTRGWILRPNLHEPFTTNSHGMRGRQEYVDNPELFTIMIFGDSFTFGAEVSDEYTWPSLLQQAEKRFQVLNMGVSGYGLDQMYLALTETISQYHPNLVILAPINDDFNRVLLGFRDYKKPLFTLSEDGQLTLTNTPIGDIDATMRELRAKYGWFTARLRLNRQDREWLSYQRSDAYGQRIKQMGRALIHGMITCATEHESAFLLTYLASSSEIEQPTGNAPWNNGEHRINEFETMLAEIAMETGVPFAPTQRAFLDAGHPWVHGHYKEAEDRFVSQLIYNAILQTPAWRKFEQANQAQGSHP